MGRLLHALISFAACQCLQSSTDSIAPDARCSARRGLVSWIVMRFSVRSIASIAAVAALALVAGVPGQAQSTAAQSTPAQTSPNGVYIAIDPLAKVRYDNRFDVSVGLGYDHMKAGPTLLQGSNLGGLDISGSYWLTKHWGIEGTSRDYFGTSGAGINHDGPNGGAIKGPFVSEYMFLGGAEYLGPHNKHGALIPHVLIGGTYGSFEKDLDGNPPSTVDFYNNQVALAGIIGGHMDLNRSEHWVFRITPDAVMTHYGINYYPNTKQYDVNFALSVGVEYKFKKKR